jgi:tetratricopeptide (TPR) repeat protein
METYRLSSKLNEEKNEYLIQTANDANQGAVSTSVYVNGVLAETVNCPHPVQVKPEEVLSLVKVTHGDKKREVETLLQAYRQVIKSGNPEMMYQLGTAFYYKGFYGESRKLFRGAVDISPEYHQARNYLGMTELALGSIQEAKEAAAKAAEQRPGYADYHNNLGIAHLADNACREAIAEFERAISINLYYAEAYFNLGLALILEAILHPGREEWSVVSAKIRDYFHKAALIHTNYRIPQFETGLTAVTNKDLKRALDIFKGIRDAMRETNRRQFAAFYMKLALFPDLASEKAVADRIHFLESELHRNPTYVDLQAELSLCYLEQAKLIWQKGVDQYRKTHELRPSLQRVRFALEEAEKINEDLGIVVKKITEQG